MLQLKFSDTFMNDIRNLLTAGTIIKFRNIMKFPQSLFTKSNTYMFSTFHL